MDSLRRFQGTWMLAPVDGDLTGDYQHVLLMWLARDSWASRRERVRIDADDNPNMRLVIEMIRRPVDDRTTLSVHRMGEKNIILTFVLAKRVIEEIRAVRDAYPGVWREVIIAAAREQRFSNAGRATADVERAIREMDT